MMVDSSGKILHHRSINACEVSLSSGERVTLPAGSFIKCVKKEYVPKYHPFSDHHPDYVAAYTQFGFGLIPIANVDFKVK